MGKNSNRGNALRAEARKLEVSISLRQLRSIIRFCSPGATGYASSLLAFTLQSPPRTDETQPTDPMLSQPCISQLQRLNRGPRLAPHHLSPSSSGISGTYPQLSILDPQPRPKALLDKCTPMHYSASHATPQRSPFDIPSRPTRRTDSGAPRSECARSARQPIANRG